jgi:hypothetical protein
MAPGGMAGNAAQATTGVKLGLEMLQKHLAGLPMGSELHSAVLKAITDISKKLDSNASDSASMMQQYSPAYQFQMQQGAQGTLNQDANAQGAESQGGCCIFVQDD